MGRPVVHWELMSKDPDRISEFYAGIFGWNVKHEPKINRGPHDGPVEDGCEIGLAGLYLYTVMCGTAL